jgi:predicted CoA-binding protein
MPTRGKTVDQSFHRLFYPRLVAVIGASGNPLKMGHQCMLSLKGANFPGPVYPVHPQAREILDYGPNENRIGDYTAMRLTDDQTIRPGD